MYGEKRRSAISDSNMRVGALEPRLPDEARAAADDGDHRATAMKLVMAILPSFG
jgi:hypothetical protein